jgi:hypothetical protein
MRLSPGYVHALHPEHGEPVTYTPGQALPQWVLEALDNGAELVPEEDGVFKLVRKDRPAPRSAKRPEKSKR